ncbi:MAG: C40 family peptidase [Deltaproteobacteria bacterium]|jgi:cell wall-associated NlpC family hydrolase|nr:C40 family peptidase [Deltaproteobacteria bacterium]
MIKSSFLNSNFTSILPRLLLILLSLLLTLTLGCVSDSTSFKPQSGLFKSSPSPEQQTASRRQDPKTLPHLASSSISASDELASNEQIASNEQVNDQNQQYDLSNDLSASQDQLNPADFIIAYSDPNLSLINQSSCVRGLTGSLSTGRAGTNFLANYARAGSVVSKTLDDNASIAALDFDNAPSSKKSLRLHNELTNQLLFDAYGQTGRPYRSAGKAPQTGFDDAGLVHWIYSQEGVKVPQNVKDQVANGQAVARDDLRPGDILVYKTPKTVDYLVGIYTGNGNFILASSKFDVVTETAAFGTDFGPYFIGGRRYIDDPSAAPLSNDLKAAATNGAVKVALSNMGDNIPKPSNIYGGNSKKPPQKNKPRRNRRRR